MAFAAREEMCLDQLIFVPANLSPFKQENSPAPEQLRMKMLRLALAGLDWCAVSDVELRRGGVSYTVDTVRELRGTFAGSQLFLLIGEDNLVGLSSWHEADELKKQVEFLVVPRPGLPPSPGVAGLKAHRLTGWPIEVASSTIRQRIREGLPVEHLVPPAVIDVIHHNRLYLP